MIKNPTPELEAWIRQNLEYDPSSGCVTCVGGTRTCRLKEGRVHITIGNTMIGYRELKCHRIAWFLYYGRWPNAQVDHIDLDPSNNRITNLREAGQSQNSANTKKRTHYQGRHPTSKYKGVYRCRTRWQAKIKHSGRDLYLGSFTSEEEAHAAYVKAAKELHKEFFRT